MGSWEGARQRHRERQRCGERGRRDIHLLSSIHFSVGVSWHEFLDMFIAQPSISRRSIDQVQIKAQPLLSI
ncbi:hypothetical protein M5D96_004582, partial [Drosophila gunungcola]